MSWFVRDFADHLAYFPNECPDYSRAPGHFTIKCHVGGRFQSNSKNYVDGHVRYVDMCDVDQISIIEVHSMFNECGEVDTLLELYYKRPSSDMEVALYPLSSDADVVEMCRHLDSCTVMYVYCESKIPVSQETVNFVPSQWLDCEFIDDPKAAEFEKQQLEELLFLEGINKDFSDPGEDIVDNPQDLLETDYDQQEDNLHLDDDQVSFHDDSSNVDSTDEDVTAARKVRGKEKVGHTSNQPTNWTEFSFDTTNEVDGDNEHNQILSDLSDCDDSDEERLVANSTDDESELLYPAFNEEFDMKDPMFEIGMTFSCATSFRKAVRHRSILQRRAIKQARNFGRRVKFLCEDENCKWKIYASPMQKSSTFQIKTYMRTHTCCETFKQSNMTASWIAKYYENDIRMNPTWPIPAFQKKIVNQWRCQVSIHTVGRAKRMALGKIRGNHKMQYSLIWDYINAVKKAMPDSTLELVLEDAIPGEERRKFKRLYVSLGPVKKGFKDGCRPIIGLDGCHLKGPYGGQLLAAVGTDSNDGMYPIAWAVVEAENNESWNWFLELLAADVGIENSGAWTFISDRQKGLINALLNVVPNAEHRFCVMHLYRNMYKEHKGIGLRTLLWLASRATTDYMFNKHMEELKKLSKKCYEWLMEKPRSQWSRSAFLTTCQSDMFVNNHCEVFNNSIGEYRDLPIIGLLQGIHKAVMKRIQTRRDKMLQSYKLNPICPNAMRKVSKAIGLSGGCMVEWSGGSKFLCIMTDGGHEIVVDLETKSCACRKFDLTGLPCYHACACIKWKNLDIANYIHKTYEKDMFLKTYTHTVVPICSEQYWEKTPFPAPLPPELKVQPGRPKKKRNKKNDVKVDRTAEASKLRRQNTTLKCSYCKESKHNARTCPAKKHDKEKAANDKAAEANDKAAEANDNAAEIGEINDNLACEKTSEGSEKTVEGNAGASSNKGRRIPKSNKKKVMPQLEKEKPITATTPFTQPQPTVSQGNTQGGIFTSYSQPARVVNTPLGIQYKNFTVRGKQTTTMREIEATRNERKANIVKQPIWKL